MRLRETEHVIFVFLFLKLGCSDLVQNFHQLATRSHTLVHVVVIVVLFFLLSVLQMASPVLLLLLLHLFGFGKGSHKHLHEDHYTGQHHNPEHNMNVLLGDEVLKYFHLFSSFSHLNSLQITCSHSCSIYFMHL